ncbi:hypothetical protein NC653_032210 [Populus alba x Populus x berolinensis]|uniref:Uncharacterized protein n=1 Tax=Populus alba x Populus x berolinensis TaxID=444605 RepID=A0AAD6PZJ1_9ROSI|nr:hypothetical protein NC653_032210 [Populus alba x Populus x berolinensis]
MLLEVERRALQWTTLISVDTTNSIRPNANQRLFIELPFRRSTSERVLISSDLSHKAELASSVIAVGLCVRVPFDAYIYSSICLVWTTMDRLVKR